MRQPVTDSRAGRRGRESGSTAVEFVLWTPLLLLMLLALVQLGLYLFAQHVATTAAQAGARAGRQDEPSDPNGWKTTASSAAVAWINDLIGKDISGNVSTVPTMTRAANACTPPIVEVTVTFTTTSLFGSFHVHGESQGPVENFYPNNC
jgi:Flp pilus assembly protein TadG